jgi:hypothetical protein
MRVCMRGAWVCGYFWTVVRLSERECARVCVHAHTRECTHVYVHTHTHNMRSIEYRIESSREARAGFGPARATTRQPRTRRKPKQPGQARRERGDMTKVSIVMFPHLDACTDSTPQPTTSSRSTLSPHTHPRTARCTHVHTRHRGLCAGAGEGGADTGPTVNCFSFLEAAQGGSGTRAAADESATRCTQFTRRITGAVSAVTARAVARQAAAVTGAPPARAARG